MTVSSLGEPVVSGASPRGYFGAVMTGVSIPSVILLAVSSMSTFVACTVVTVVTVPTSVLVITEVTVVTAASALEVFCIGSVGMAMLLEEEGLND